METVPLSWGNWYKNKRKCLRCNWHHAIVQLSNDYSVSSSTFTHVEAWALLLAWCVSAEVRGLGAGPWLNLGVHYTICFFLHHAAKHLGQPHDSSYFLSSFGKFFSPVTRSNDPNCEQDKLVYFVWFKSAPMERGQEENIILILPLLRLPPTLNYGVQISGIWLKKGWFEIMLLTPFFKRKSTLNGV